MKNNRFSPLLALGLTVLIGPRAHAMEPTNAVVTAEFIFEQAPFPSCHASTIEDTGGGLVAAWFGGTDEGNPDVGIWVSRHDGGGWSPPVEVAKGIESGKQYPCWNPVLFQAPDGPLVLFYKVGPKPSAWWGMRMVSNDAGRTWTKPERLPEGIIGPVKDKPVLLDDGRLLCGSSTEDHGWRIHLEWTRDLGRTWKTSGPLNDGKEFAAIQPTLLTWPEDRIQMLCRSRQKEIVECWSTDNGRSWGPLRATDLPNPNSGIDAVKLKDGRALLVYNHTTRGRTPLNVAVSKDGKAWQKVLTLETEPGEYSYPAVIQSHDGKVQITYTWKRRRIKHVVLDPALLH